MRYRKHRAGYSESMATTCEFDGTWAGLLVLEPTARSVKYYADDGRNGWSTFVVMDEDGVLGFTNGPVCTCVGPRIIGWSGYSSAEHKIGLLPDHSPTCPVITQGD